MQVERPKLSSFLNKEGKTYIARHLDSGEECGTWRLDSLKQYDSPPISGLEDLDCFGLLFLSGKRYHQGYYVLQDADDPQAVPHELFCTPTMAFKGDPAMQVVIN